MQQCVGLDDVVDAARRAAHCVHQVRWTRASYGTSADSRWDGWTYMDVPYAKLSIRDRSKVKIAPVHPDSDAAFCAAVPDGICWLTPRSLTRTLGASSGAGFANHGLTCLAITA